MLRTHLIALDPNKKQATALTRHVGYARKAWNHALADFKAGRKDGEFRNDRKLRRRFNEVKASAYSWSSELSQNAAKNAIINLGRAIDAWQGKTQGGAKRKRKNRFPRHKKKGRHDSFRADNGRGTVKVRGAAIRLPRIGWIRMREELRFAGDVASVTVSRKAGRWFAAVTVETGDEPPTMRDGATIGVDVGVERLAVCSDGIVYSNPKPLKRALGRLARLQRRKARGREGSKRNYLLKERIAKLHKRIRDIRADAHHKATTAIAKRSGRVVCETLNVKGMTRNRRLARSVSDSAMSEFVRMLEYKCELYGVAFEKADKWFPSSQLCSRCGARNRSLTLATREWRCESCGAVHDRDLNAAINLAASSAASGRGDCVGPGGFVRSAAIREASTERMMS